MDGNTIAIIAGTTALVILIACMAVAWIHSQTEGLARISHSLNAGGERKSNFKS